MKKHEFDCTGEENRAEAFTFLQTVTSMIRNTRKQFTVLQERHDDGSTTLTIKTNGKTVGQNDEKSEPPTGGDQASGVNDAPAGDDKTKQSGTPDHKTKK